MARVLLITSRGGDEADERVPPRRISPSSPPMAHQNEDPMKLIQLRYLVAVAENDLNITQAARALHAAQPGVSKQLKQLEDELGFQLFERKGRALVDRKSTRLNSSHSQISYAV